MTTSALLACQELRVGHHRRALLPPINLELRPGEFWIVLGRNGTGKSTWLKTVLGLMPQVSGRVLWPAGTRPRLIYLAQRAGFDPLYPLSVRDAVALGTERRWSFLTRRRSALAIDRALQWMGIADLQHRSFRLLSEGQRQRVLFARIAASEAQIAFLDEPTSALDPVAERETFELMLRLALEQQMAVVVITHCLQLGRQLADRALLLDNSPPTAAVGTPEEIYSHPTFQARYGEAITGASHGC